MQSGLGLLLDEMSHFSTDMISAIYPTDGCEIGEKQTMFLSLKLSMRGCQEFVYEKDTI
jgi:hypothetical protein